MMTAKALAALTALFVAMIGSPALAQTAGDPHHPSETESGPANTADPQLPVQNSQPSMMGMMQMMNMMGQRGMPMPGMSMGDMDLAGMTMIDHAEGRIAFLRAELKITNAQAEIWDTFATALRDNAMLLGEVRTQTGGPAASPSGLAQRLAHQEQWLTARLEGIRGIKAAFGPLYGALSVQQRKLADELLGTHMGLMHLGMMPMGMMQMGGATP